MLKFTKKYTLSFQNNLTHTVTTNQDKGYEEIPAIHDRTMKSIDTASVNLTQQKVKVEQKILKLNIYNGSIVFGMLMRVYSIIYKIEKTIILCIVRLTFIIPTTHCTK